MTLQKYTIIDNTQKDNAVVFVRENGFLGQPDVFLNVCCGKQFNVLSLSVQAARDLADALNNCANEMIMRKS